MRYSALISDMRWVSACYRSPSRVCSFIRCQPAAAIISCALFAARIRNSLPFPPVRPILARWLNNRATRPSGQRLPVWSVRSAPIGQRAWLGEQGMTPLIARDLFQQPRHLPEGCKRSRPPHRGLCYSEELAGRYGAMVGLEDVGKSLLDRCRRDVVRTW